MNWRKPGGIRMWGFWVATGVTAIMVILYLISPRLLDDLENKSLDSRFLTRGEVSTSGTIVIIAIDERSIAEFGRWPWSRDRMGDLIRGIASAGAKVIGVDIIYSEPEITDRLKTIQDLQREITALDSDESRFSKVLEKKQLEASTDALFADAIGEAGNVVMALAPIIGGSGHGPNYAQVTAETTPQQSETPFEIGRYVFNIVKGASRDKIFDPLEATDILPPLPELARQASGLGHVYATQDRDGVIRYGALTVKYNDDYFPSLPLAVAQAYLDIPWSQMSLHLAESVTLGDITIPTDERGRMLLYHYGQQRSFPYYSAAAILKNELLPGTLEGKIVFVGTTTIGGYDLRVSPFDANIPGVEINAAVAENIIHGQFLHRSELLKVVDLIAIILGGLLAGLIIPNVRGLYGTAAVIGFLAWYLFLAQYLFVASGLWISLVYPLLTILLCYIALTVLSYMTEERRAKEIRSMFTSFVNPRIVEELIRHPDAIKLGGYRREVTLLFSDIRGFTTFSEKHRDEPEKIVVQLNEYLQAMTEEVFRTDGTLDKFVGDAVMAYWSAPIEQPNHAELGITCALAMRRRLKELNEKWASEGKEPFEIGIGLHTGDAVVGNMGAKGLKMDYTAIGDTVNLAARLEGTTKEYATHVIVSKETNTRAGSGFTTRELDYIAVKGKDKPVTIFDVLGEAKNASASQLQQRDAFELALTAYRKKEWDEAEKQLNLCLSANEDDGPARTFHARIQPLRETPPPEGWDGVWRMTKK